MYWYVNAIVRDRESGCHWLQCTTSPLHACVLGVGVLFTDTTEWNPGSESINQAILLHQPRLNHVQSFGTKVCKHTKAADT